MRHFFLTCALAGMSLVATNAMAGVVYSNDFEGASTTGFSSGSIITAPNGQNFLGQFGQGSGTTLSITGLAPHTDVTLSFTLDVVGSMDGTGPSIAGGGPGDFFTVDFSGDTSSNLFDYAFANYDGGNLQSYPSAGSAPATGNAGIDTLGYSGFPDSGNGIQDTIYNFTLTPITDAAGSISFTFTSLSNESLGNEFYGIDNVVVSTSGVAPTPEPATLVLFAAGLCILPLVKRLRQS